MIQTKISNVYSRNEKEEKNERKIPPDDTFNNSKGALKVSPQKMILFRNITFLSKQHFHNMSMRNNSLFLKSVCRYNSCFFHRLD